jgi:hypothetical protein
MNLIKAISMVQFSKNPIVIGVQAGLEFQTPPPTPWGYLLTFHPTTPIPNGSKITIKIYDYEYSVTFKASPNTSAGLETQSLLVVSAALIDAWLTSPVLVDMAKNFVTANLMTVQHSATTTDLIFTAPADSNLVVTCDVPASTVTLTSAGVQFPKPENYHLLFRLKDGYGNKIADLKSVPDFSSPYHGYIDASEVADNMVSRTLPNYNTGNSVGQATSNKAYISGTATEGYGIPNMYYGHISIGAGFVYKGGTSSLQFKRVGHYVTHFVNDSFLTWQPRNKKTSADTLEFLYAIIFTFTGISAGNLRMYVKGYYENGTTNTAYYTNANPVYFGDVVLLNATGLAAEAASASPLVKWEVWLEDNTGFPYSEVMTYTNDAICRPFEYEFLFGNSVGGFDTLRCARGASVGLQVAREEASRIIPYIIPANSEELGDSYIYKVSAAKRVKCNTGLISRETIEWLHDFAVSDEVYFISKEDHGFIPVKLVSNSIQLYSDTTTGLYSLEFEVEFMNDESLYSPAGL